MTKPCHIPRDIPRDLKPGDRLWYSETEYATVEKRPGHNVCYWQSGAVNAYVNGNIMYYGVDGKEEWGDTPDIIRIERIASKPKRAKGDRDAKLLNLVAEELSAYVALSGRPGITFDPPKQWVRRLRAIARRLENMP